MAVVVSKGVKKKKKRKECGVMPKIADKEFGSIWWWWILEMDWKTDIQNSIKEGYIQYTVYG